MLVTRRVVGIRPLITLNANVLVDQNGGTGAEDAPWEIIGLE